MPRVEKFADCFSVKQHSRRRSESPWAYGWLRCWPAGSPSRCHTASLRSMNWSESKTLRSPTGKFWKRLASACQRRSSLHGFPRPKRQIAILRILHPGAGIEVFSPLRKRGLLRRSPGWDCLWTMRVFAKRRLEVPGVRRSGAIIAGFSLLVPWLALGVALFFRNLGTIFRLPIISLVRSTGIR